MPRLEVAEQFGLGRRLKPVVVFVTPSIGIGSFDRISGASRPNTSFLRTIGLPCAPFRACQSDLATLIVARDCDGPEPFVRNETEDTMCALWQVGKMAEEARRKIRRVIIGNG